MNEEKYDPIEPDKVKKGDYIRVECQGGVKLEGPVNWTSGSGAMELGASPNTAVGLYSEQIEKVYRRRPQVVLPTRAGSAVLIYDTAYLENRVVILRSGGDWSSTSGIWSADQARQHYVRTIFDAAKEA